MDEKVVCGIGENRPNYKIGYLSEYIDRVDAEMFLASLPIQVLFNPNLPAKTMPLYVLVQGPTIQIFPSEGTEIRGILFEQKGEDGEAAAKIRVESIACELEDVNTGEVFNESSTFRVKPSDLGVHSWVGLYDFQRQQHATEDVVIFIYKRPRGKW